MNRTRTCAALAALLLLVLVVLPPGAAFAAARAPGTSQEGFTADQVRSAVETWVRGVTADARPDATVEWMEPYTVDGETVAYIAHLVGGGFCLTGADPLVLPVYFYSPHGVFNPTSPDLGFILDEIGGRLAWNRQAVAAGGDCASESLQVLFTERAVFWDALIAGQVPPRSAALASPQAPPSRLELPVTSLWHQGSPYNDQLPELTPGADERPVIGCNATATAQIMYYWKWPATGVGSGSVTYPYRYRTTWDSEPLAASPTISAGFAGRLSYDATNHRLRMNGYWDGSIHQAAIDLAPSNAAYQAALNALWARMTVAQKVPAANFGSTTYNWSLLRDTHADPVDAGDAEAAKFNAHVAIAVESNLGAWGTGSFFGNDVAGLREHFRYDPDALFTAAKVNGGAGADIYSLTEEIQWGRPAGLGGANLAKGGGHAWVVYGYNTATDPNRQFLMNLGWGGSDNGWYTYDHSPFPDYNDMMTRVAPLNVKFVGAGAAGDGSPASPYRNIEEALSKAPNGSTLIFKAGSVNVFAAGKLVIDRPLVLKGWGATVTK